MGKRIFETALSLIQAQELAKLQSQMQPVPTFPGQREERLPRNLQEIWKPDSGTVLVAAGQLGTVYSFKLNEKYTDMVLCGVITGRAWVYNPNDEIYFEVDGRRPYDNPIEFALGEYPNTVHRCLVPFENEVVVQVRNKDAVDHFCGVMCTGWVADIRDKNLLLSLAIRGAI